MNMRFYSSPLTKIVIKYLQQLLDEKHRQSVKGMISAVAERVKNAAYREYSPEEYVSSRNLSSALAERLRAYGVSRIREGPMPKFVYGFFRPSEEGTIYIGRFQFLPREYIAMHEAAHNLQKKSGMLGKYSTREIEGAANAIALLEYYKMSNGKGWLSKAVEIMYNLDGNSAITSVAGMIPYLRETMSAFRALKLQGITPESYNPAKAPEYMEIAVSGQKHESYSAASLCPAYK